MCSISPSIPASNLLLHDPIEQSRTNMCLPHSNFLLSKCHIASLSFLISLCNISNPPSFSNHLAQRAQHPQHYPSHVWEQSHRHTTLHCATNHEVPTFVCVLGTLMFLKGGRECTFVFTYKCLCVFFKLLLGIK